MFKRGQKLKDTYRVESPISGSKLAYKVTHLGLGTDLVAEVVADLTGIEELDYDERQQATKEFAATSEIVKAFAKLDHPTLAGLVDSFEVDKVHVLIRPWVEGLTLRELVETSLKPLDQRTATEFGEQILLLFEEMKRAEPPLVLGSLCPDFLVVSPEGQIEVIDYGLAVHKKGKTQFEAFGCPELLGGAELDQRADLYSLGATLFFAVTGQELPPIWDRITHKESIPSPLELNISVDGSFWSTLEQMLSLNVNLRPQSTAEVRALFEGQDFEDTAETSPATWYPEQSELMLADSYAFAPFHKPDWILKIVQAAVVGRARRLAVVQSRQACVLNCHFAEPDIPSPQGILAALTSDAPISNPVIAEVACGLRIIGEFRDFRLVLDDWKQSWSLACRGGKISTQAGTSQGRTGMFLEVFYEGRAAYRAAQAADELTRLVRKTRLCGVPISIGKKSLEPGRGTSVRDVSKDVAELYLASASIPASGQAILSEVQEAAVSDESSFTTFAPKDGALTDSHIDVRCFIAPGESAIGKTLHKGFHFLRKPSRVLWYRRGVLCGQQLLQKSFPLQLDIHLNGDHLEVDNAGLNVEMPEWLQASRLRPVLELSRVLPLTKLKLEEFWNENPAEVSPKGRTIVGAMSAPLMLLFFGKIMGPGLFLLKKTAFAALWKSTAAAGGLAGFSTARVQEEAIRETCLKAIEIFESEEI